MKAIGLWGAESTRVKLGHHGLGVVYEALLIHWVCSINAVHTIPHVCRRALLGACRRLAWSTGTALGVLQLCSPLLLRDTLSTHHQVNIRLLVRHGHTAVLSLHCL
jgi:hypothetical protein